MKDINPDDPVASLADLDGADGKLERDEDGYTRWIPSEERQEELGEFFYEQINQTLSDYEDWYSAYRENIEAYRGQDSAFEDSAVLTLPIVGRLVDQMIAWELTTTMRPNPIISVRPEFPADYEVPTMTRVPSQMGEIEVPTTVNRSSEEVATAFELGINYHLRQKQDFRRKQSVAAKDRRLSGQAIYKVIYDRKTRPIDLPKYKQKGPFLELIGTERKYIQDGEACKILNVSPFNFIYPRSEDDIQESPWIAERTPESPSELRACLSTGYYNLVRDEALRERLLKETTDKWMVQAEQDVRATVDRRKASKLKQMHDIWEVWFDWPIKEKVTGEDGKTKTKAVMYKLMGHFHMGIKRFLMIVENPYSHKLRPYVVDFEDEERGTSSATVSKGKKHQALASQFLHLDAKNAVQANNFVWFYNPDSEAGEALAQMGYKIESGACIPRVREEDMKGEQAGSNHPGLMQQMGFVLNDLRETYGISSYEEGMAIPGRTPAASIAQIMEAGYMRPVMELQARSDALRDVLRLYVLTKAQYEPFGESIPFTDPETKELVEVPMRYPLEDFIDNFRITLTAADEAVAREAEYEKRAMDFQMMMQAGQMFVQMVGAMADPGASPAMTEYIGFWHEAMARKLETVLETDRRDVTSYRPPKELIDSLLQEKQMVRQMMEQQQAMMGAQGAGPTGDQSVGMGGMGGAPANAGVPQGPPVA